MKLTFCGNARTAVYLTAEGLPCLPGIPCVMKQGNKATLLVVNPHDEQIKLSVPVDLPSGSWDSIPDGSYLVANGAASYVDGLLVLTRGSSLVEV